MLITHKNGKRLFVRLCGPGNHQLLRISLFSIFLSLLAGTVLLLSLGKNPLEAYQSILQGAGLLPKLRYAGKKSQLTDFMSLLNYTTPMIFAALSVAVALKNGIFNICVSGIMVLSGFLATVLVGYSSLDPVLAKILVVVIGTATGALVGMFIGYLKYRFNMNEVVVAIMLNYIISYVVSFFIQTKFIDPITRQSVAVGQNARLTLFDYPVGNLKMEIALVFPLALLVVFALRFLLNRTRFGFELRAVGSNSKASKYAGIEVGKVMVMTMLLSGALAGLAGVSYYLGSNASIQPRVLPSLGFDGIAVALLGNMSAIGSLFASLLVMIFDCGTTYMSSRLSVLREIAALIISILLLFSAIGIFFRSLANRYAQQLEEV
ncbi:MAG: ABC transporter permease [Sphaerochaeta sp.]|jgi:simple sugar transport system permease protein|uniref:ABC transporter permease n=1 Tax=Sphaerochaeta sp. TaxID=1972642 RepID=UPI002FC97737